MAKTLPSILFLTLPLFINTPAYAESANADGKSAVAEASNSGSDVLEKVTVTDDAVSNAEYNPPNSKPQLDTETQTGSRLGLTARETPASITVIDRKTIEKRGAYTTQEALERSPGITVSSQPGSAGSVSMRGFTGNQVTQLFNGITVQYDVVAARPIDSWLYDRVEVLGGPSSFLYGQTAVGGAINNVSKIATRDDDKHSALVTLGEYLNRRGSYGYNGRVGDSDNWFQANLSYTGQEGYFNNSQFDSGVMSFSLLSDINDSLSHTIAVEHQIEDRDSYWGTPVLNPVINGKIVPWGDDRITSGKVGKIDPRTRFENYNAKDSVFDQQVTWVRDILEYQLNNSTKLKNTLYYYRGDRQYRNVEGADWNSTNTLIGRRLSFAVDHNQTLIGDRIEASHETELFSLPTKIFGGIDVAYNNQTRSPSTESSGQLGGLISPYNFVATDTYSDNPLANRACKRSQERTLDGRRLRRKSFDFTARPKPGDWCAGGRHLTG